MRSRNCRAVSLGVLLGISTLVSSCASTGSKIAFHEETPANEGDVIVYVYRMPSMVGAAVAWVVRLDGQDVAVLRQNAYIALHTTPGAHEIKVGDNPIGLAGVVVEATTGDKRMALLSTGTSYYLRCAGFKFGFVSREEAMKELPGMKFDEGRPASR